MAASSSELVFATESQTGLICEILDPQSLGWKIPEFSFNKQCTLVQEIIVAASI